MKKIFLIVCIAFVTFAGCRNEKVLPLSNISEPVKVESVSNVSEPVKDEPISNISESVEIETVSNISESVEIETVSNISESVEIETVSNISESAEIKTVSNVSEPVKSETLLEEALKTELISLGLLREPTVDEKQQYDMYTEKVKEYVESIEPSSAEIVISEYNKLLNLIKGTNKEFRTNALVCFDGNVVEPAELPALVAKREMLIIPCDEKYEERYRVYEEQYELCYDINSECSRALRNKDYYNYVKLLHNYSIEEEKLLEMEKNLE